jgi:aminobenzoyl-glutamate utilization protein B
MRRKLSAAVALGFTLLAHSAGAQTDARKALAYAAIDRNADQIATIGDTVYFFGELGMQEIESAKFVKGVLESIGFTVETGTAGMNTNIWAHWGTGKPQIVIVSEIDALPGGSQAPLSIDHKPLVGGAPGHMEGHNTHAGVAIGAAYAVKQAMQRYNIPGSVAISFGPAEEQIVSRPFLVRAGLYANADLAILLHIGDGFAAGYGLMNYAAISAKFDFHGKTAHGAVDPWNGKDAVDAVELMDLGFDKLREHLRPTYRAHRAITAGGVQPNIIADYGQIWWFVRDANMAAAKETFDKLVKIAEGAAVMTGTTMDYKIDAAAWPQLGLKPVAEAVQANIEAIGMPLWTEEEQAFARKFQTAMGARPIGLRTATTPLGQRPQSASSNDNGDVTWVVPSAALNRHRWRLLSKPVLPRRCRLRTSLARLGTRPS